MDTTYESFCGELDKHYRAIAKIRELHESADRRAAAIRYYAEHEAIMCAPGTEFVVNADRTIEVK